jgi:putative Mn2+ efflux pump MntP
MEILTLILIGFGLTGDTLAVSITSGLSMSHIRFTQALRIAIVLSVFQALMPLLGWFLGLQIRDYIIEFDHWIAFVLLSIIGGRMIFESLKSEEEKKEFNPMKFNVLIGMAIATSIDALIVGISFAFISVDIVLTTSIIWFLTFMVAMTGVLIGKKTGNLLGKKAEILGGVILIAIGVKILIQHLLEA